MKLKNYGRSVNAAGADMGIVYVFYCPGCGYDHPIHTGGDPLAHPQWEFNGDLARPTISPSLMVNRDAPGQVCHSFIADGRIQFLSDCWHPLAGQTMEIPEYEDEYEYPPSARTGSTA